MKKHVSAIPKGFLWITGSALLTLHGVTAAAESSFGPSRQTLLQKEIPLATNRIRTNVIRVEFPSGYQTPLHTHKGPGPRYVLKGTLRVEDAAGSRDYGPGDVFWETGEAMTVKNISGGDAAIVIFELETL
jgi:quercetin dioxygenase-like cupin family protein